MKDPVMRIESLENRYRCLLLAWVSALLLIFGLNVRVFYVRAASDKAADLTATCLEHVHESIAALGDTCKTLGNTCETLGRRPVAEPLPPLALVLVPTGQSTACLPISPPPTRINGQTVDGATIWCDTVHRACQTPEGGNDVVYAVKTVAGEDTHLAITMHHNSPHKPLEIQDDAGVPGWQSIALGSNGQVLTISNGTAVWSTAPLAISTR